MQPRSGVRQLFVVFLPFVLATVLFQPASGAAGTKRMSATLRRLLVRGDAPVSAAGRAATNQIVLTAADYDYSIQADSYADPTNTIVVLFEFSPADLPAPDVSFSLSPPCGSLNPTSARAEKNAGTGLWWVTTEYTPCEDECTTVAITAEPALGESQTQTIHLDERWHTGCGTEEPLGVYTWEVDTEYPFANTPARDFVEVRVIPPEAGTATPPSGYSQLEDGLYVFSFTYVPDCSYAGRVRVACSGDMISFDQNTQAPAPSASWQTICEDFCTEGDATNYCQVHKMYLYGSCGYDFTLDEWDGVGARCDAGIYTIEMFDSTGDSLWYVDNLWDYGSTLGTLYEEWSPPSNGWYYVHVSGFDFLGYGTAMSYCLAYMAQGEVPAPDAPNDVSASDGTYADQVHIEWNAAEGADEYRVFRAASLEGAKTALGSWQTSTSYDDSPPQSGVEYHYWVKARDFAGKESPYSAPDTGWRESPPLANDAREDAAEIIEDVPCEGSTAGATGTDESGCGQNDTKDVWYSYTATTTGFLTVSLVGRTFDTTLAVYDPCSGAELACSSDPSSLDSKIMMAVTGGHTCLIRVAGCDGATGDYTLTVIQGLVSDINAGNSVGLADFAILAAQWRQYCLTPDDGEPAGPDPAAVDEFDDGVSMIADLNGDCWVDFSDLALFCDEWPWGLAKIVLSNATVPENQPAGTVVGALSWLDPDVYQRPTLTFELVDAYEDSSLFGIAPETWELLTLSELDYEDCNAYRIKVWAMDSSSPPVSYEQAFTIAVTDVSDNERLPVYRFWSYKSGAHIYTMSETERQKLDDYPDDAMAFEGIAFYAYPEGLAPSGTAPIYRFWSHKSGAHIYTMSETERQKLDDFDDDIVAPEGIVFYAYPEGSAPSGTAPVYRFWSPRSGAHIYTMSEAEKQKLDDYPDDVVVFEGIAWYAYAP